MHSLDERLITIDVDWASDQDIWNVAKSLIENRTKATWFITHNSPVIKKIFEYPHLFEVGVHPNFCDGSTQGETPKQVMEYLKEIAPDAKSVRPHCLVQSTNLLRMMRKDYDIMYDVSMFLPKTPHIIPHRFYFEKDRFITRIPYFWEDDVAIFDPDKCFDVYNERYCLSGLKIFNFHPQIITNSKPIKLFFKELTKLLQSKGRTIKEIGEDFNMDRKTERL